MMECKTMKTGRLIALLMAGVFAVPAVADEPPKAAAQLQAATKIAGADAKAMPLFLCKPHAGFVIRNALENGSKIRVEPTMLFDNLYSISSQFVGVLAFTTSGGKLDAKNVLGLRRYADRITDPRYTEAMTLIDKAIRKPESKEYFRVWVKDNSGEYQDLQLNFSAL